MISENKKEIRKKILDGIDKAYKKLIETKKSKGEKLVISKDGQIISINPNEI